MAGTVPIQLDKARNLKLDFNALADADSVDGRAINEFLSGQRGSMAAIRALMWAGLKHEDPRLTVQEVGQLIQDAMINGGDSLASLSTKIHEAIIAAGMFAAKKNGMESTSHPSTSPNG